MELEKIEAAINFVDYCTPAETNEDVEGVMVLSTHENQIKDFGEEKYLRRQKEMFRNDMTEETENEQ